MYNLLYVNNWGIHNPLMKGGETAMKKALFLFLLFIIGCTAKEATWRALPEIRQTEYENAWSIIVGAVSEKYELEVIDANSGYLRSSWKEKKDWLGTKEYRTRVVVRVVSREPLKVKLKVEKQTWNSWTNDWLDAGNEEEFQSQLLEELEARLK